MCAGSAVCILGDFNTRFDAGIPHRIGEHVWPTKWEVPPCLLSLLHEQDVWLPATFQGLHAGQHDTWFAPNGLAAARLDYLAVPSGWSVLQGASRVLLDIDTGHQSVDHLPVLLDVHVPPSTRRGRRAKLPSFDRDKMATVEGQTVLRRICEEAPLLPWSWDADSHFHAFQSFVLGRLTQSFPRSRRHRRGSFLSDSTWVLRDHRTWLRRQVVAFKVRARTFLERLVFGVWCHRWIWGKARVLIALDLCKQACDVQALVARLRESKRELRVSIRNDRKKWMHDLACKADELSTRDVVQRLRPLLRASGNKQKSQRSLPAVLLETGELAASEDEALARWIRHFSAIEGGEVCDEQHVQLARKARLLREDKEPLEILPGDVPSRIELERALQRTSAHKACGPDGLPGELLKYGNGCASKPLYQLLLKLSVRQDEAAVMKGGLQYFLWKGKGSQSICEHHRAILVSSVVAKSFHAVLRDRCLPAFESCAAPLQVGGLPKRPVTFAAHAIRLYQGLHRQGNYFLLFLDLRDAFYRVVRAFVSTDCPSDDQIAATFRALQIPPPPSRLSVSKLVEALSLLRQVVASGFRQPSRKF